MVILVKGRNSYAVLPEKLDCDYYRFLQGDPAAVNAFQNDYMAAYSWAEIRNAELVQAHQFPEQGLIGRFPGAFPTPQPGVVPAPRDFQQLA